MSFSDVIIKKVRSSFNLTPRSFHLQGFTLKSILLECLMVSIPDDSPKLRIGQFKDEKVENRAVLIVSFCAFWILFLPKAGVRVNGLPLFVSSFCLLLLVVFLALRKKALVNRSQVSTYVIFSACWYFLVIFRNSDFQISLGNKFAALSWFFLSPIFWILASNFRLRTRTFNINWIYLAFSLLSIYSIAQVFFGLEFLQFPGLTIALGDSYEGKNLRIYEGSHVVAVKSPSTYQSGNLFGQSAAIILIWIIELNSRKKYGSGKLRLFMIFSMAFALLLSFSRTALLALLLGCLVSFTLSQSRRRGFLGLVVILMTFLAIFNPLIANRFSFANMTSDAGRTGVWSEAFDTYVLSDWLFGRVGPSPRNDVIMEGAVGLISQVGICGLLFIVFCWKKSGLTKWPGLTATFWFCVAVDSTYYFAPFMWIPGLVLIYGSNLSLPDSAKMEFKPDNVRLRKRT